MLKCLNIKMLKCKKRFTLLNSRKANLTGFTLLEINRAKKKNRKNKSLTGFTIIELMITIFVILTGVAGTLVVIQHSIRAVSVSSDRFTAAYLAKEGMEIVRNIRDNNFLREITPWDTGLTTGNYMVDFDDLSLTAYIPNTLLLINPDGFFNYDSGTLTKFNRKITLTTLNATSTRSEVRVYWIDRGREYHLIVEETLTVWR